MITKRTIKTLAFPKLLVNDTSPWSCTQDRIVKVGCYREVVQRILYACTRFCCLL